MGNQTNIQRQEAVKCVLNIMGFGSANSLNNYQFPIERKRQQIKLCVSSV
jgi:hypothetical protein